MHRLTYDATEQSFCPRREVNNTVFPDHWPDFPDSSLTAVKFRNISRFSRQVVTLWQSLRLWFSCCTLWQICVLFSSEGVCLFRVCVVQRLVYWKHYLVYFCCQLSLCNTLKPSVLFNLMPFLCDLTLSSKSDGYICCIFQLRTAPTAIVIKMLEMPSSVVLNKLYSLDDAFHHAVTHLRA